jgi:hypothetical protein
MAWDRDRPVPWPRLLRQFAVYLLLFNAALFIFARDEYGPGIILGSVVGALFYVVLAWLLVKFGWTPPGGRRAAPAPDRSGPAARTAPERPSGPRTRPAPTKRTSGGTPRRRPPSRPR